MSASPVFVSFNLLSFLTGVIAGRLKLLLVA